MEEVRQRGWCRCFGINGRELEFLRRCVESDRFDTLLVFQRFDLLEQSALPLFREARAHDMGVVLGSPLRLGLFGSARNELLARCDDGDRRQSALKSPPRRRPPRRPRAALRFALAPPEVSVVLSGAASPAEIESAAAPRRRAPLPGPRRAGLPHWGRQAAGS